MTARLGVEIVTVVAAHLPLQLLSLGTSPLSNHPSSLSCLVQCLFLGIRVGVDVVLSDLVEPL